MNVFNLLSKKNLQTINLINVTVFNNSKYLLSIPHSGLLIPNFVYQNIKIGSEILTGTDLYTNQIYLLPNNSRIISKINPNILNLGRDKKIDKKLPKHLQTSPLTPYKDEELTIIKRYDDDQKIRLLNLYDQYHNSIKEALDLLLNKHGFALMLDGHSLASKGLSYSPDPYKKRASFILGTLDDTSAEPEIIKAFYSILKRDAEKYGWDVVKNNPYKGGYITIHYHNLERKINVMQLEVNKSIYMNEKTFEPYPDKIKIINKLIKHALDEAYKTAKKIYE